MLKFDVLNRWSGKAQFTAEIDYGEDAPFGVKVGLAVRWAFKSGADLCDAVLRDAVLRDAVLCDADLSGAVLSGAVLRGADLSGAVLSGANLSGANLRNADLRGAVLRDARVIFAGADERGYEFYLAAGAAPNDLVIRAGCRRWATFAEARSHFAQGYASTGNVPEILAKIDLLETVAKARGYLTVEPVKAA